MGIGCLQVYISRFSAYVVLQPNIFLLVYCFHGFNGIMYLSAH